MISTVFLVPKPWRKRSRHGWKRSSSQVFFWPCGVDLVLVFFIEQVAVRVRPLIQREIDAGVCIWMNHLESAMTIKFRQTVVALTSKVCVCVCVKFQATIAVAIQHNVLLLRLMDVHNNILECSMVACPCPLHWQTIVFRLSLWIMLVNVAPSGAVTEMNFSSLFFQKHVPYVQVWSCLLECGCKRSWLCWPGQCF